MKEYDYLIVGSGLFGATFAHKATVAGKKCLVIDKRNHIGGNVYCESIDSINVHKYGAHIFHTSNREIWEFVNSFVDFNSYQHSVIAKSSDEVYNLPFNMNTFNKLWGVKTPDEAKRKIDMQREDAGISKPSNLEEQAIYLVGRDMYNTLIKGYTEKQWGCKATELPPFIIKRLPVRFKYNNNYFNDTYQGIPVGGYNKLIEGLLEGSDVKLNCDYFTNRDELDLCAERIIFTGRIDEYYDFKYGRLDYRGLKFETETKNIENFQGCSVVNYCDSEIPFTRIIEHKHFEFGEQPKTVITKEYPIRWKEGMEAYYPINNEKNNEVYKLYKELAETEKNIYFGGRLAEYKYYDMHNVIEKSLLLAAEIL